MIWIEIVDSINFHHITSHKGATPPNPVARKGSQGLARARKGSQGVRRKGSQGLARARKGSKGSQGVQGLARGPRGLPLRHGVRGRGPLFLSL